MTAIGYTLNDQPYSNKIKIIGDLSDARNVRINFDVLTAKSTLTTYPIEKTIDLFKAVNLQNGLTIGGFVIDGKFNGIWPTGSSQTARSFVCPWRGHTLSSTLGYTGSAVYYGNLIVNCLVAENSFINTYDPRKINYALDDGDNNSGNVS